MLMDKFQWIPLNGKFFALFGVANLLLYGASFVITKE